MKQVLCSAGKLEPDHRSRRPPQPPPTARRHANRKPPVIFNTLDGTSGFNSAGMRSHPEQWLVMFAMESGKYYPQMYQAKEAGFNISAGACSVYVIGACGACCGVRLWRGVCGQTQLYRQDGS
jgi:hypothetical protein